MKQTVLVLTEIHPLQADPPDLFQRAVSAWLARALSR